MPWPTPVVLFAVVALVSISMASAWGLGTLSGIKAIGVVAVVGTITGWAGFWAQSAAGSTESAGAGAAQQMTVGAKDYSFTPAAVTVKANSAVQITLTNGATQAHNWTVQGLDQPYTTGDILAGKTGTVSFTPSKTGTFKIICTIAGHESFGMVGQLIVQ